MHLARMVRAIYMFLFRRCSRSRAAIAAVLSTPAAKHDVTDVSMDPEQE